MSGLEVVGLVVGVVPVLFKAVGAAWKAVEDTVDFDDETEDLGIRLETAKAHLGLWGAQAGVTQGRLVDTLVLYEELIVRIMTRIRDLVEDAERERAKYGIAAREGAGSGDKRLEKERVRATLSVSFRAAMANMRGRSSGARLAAPERTNETSMARRVLWAIHDRVRFEGFVEKLERHVQGLQPFVAEGARRQLVQEGTRLTLMTLGGLNHPHNLAQLQHASPWDRDSAQLDVRALAHWKAISLQRPPTVDAPGADADDWTLAGSPASLDGRSRTRFIRRGRVNPGAAYLFEKKAYDEHISRENKNLLRDRIRQLVELLSGPQAQQYLHTLQPVGYLDDLENCCWWIVFRFPLGPLDTGDLTLRQPLSLRTLLSSAAKPALEDRYRLAKSLASGFASLYGGDWMHKGINSANIIFPQTHAPETVPVLPSLDTALVQGFNYSRQLTQTQTVDKGKVLNDLEAAIYRHPDYQGEAASGYQIHYDIYSLGLVLFEIAVWAPLMDMLAAKPMKDSIAKLSRHMGHFHEMEALELKNRVNVRVKFELAYRVGSKYKDAVEWCLNLHRPVTAVDFYNNVAIPLDDPTGNL